MRKWLAGFLRPTEPAPCGRCGALAAEVAWHREQHDHLLDRLFAAAGALEATREALAVPRDPTGEPVRIRTEDDPETITEEMEEEVLQEQRRFAEAAGVPVESTYE